ncbi:MAG TPA: S1 RNA-binding domain-containing protein [Anaerolineaceae bacterium]|nr:S1 RNA-binding domain-containing protein [Anaerolineaceae bacterium]
MSDNAESLQANEQPQEEDIQHMGDLLDAEGGLTFDFPKAGEIRDGIIASISEGQILVSVGAKSEGLIAGKEYEAIPSDILSTLVAGKAIPVYVVTPEDSNGNLILSFIRAVEEQSWLDAEALMQSGEAFESTIVGYNKGGLLVPLSTIRGFIPASQLALSRRLAITGETPEAKYKELIGEKVKVAVIEVDRERHRLILSERAASNETRDQIRDMILDELQEGEVKVGRVTSLADFGAFVSIGGADGLVHLSEVSWEHLTHPSQALKVGDEVKVKVISIDKERRRIGLSIRQLQGDPWTNQVAALKVGQLVEAEITRLTNFGAFAKLDMPGDLEGLIHISELSERRVEHPKEVLKVGDKITLRVIKIDDESRRIGLSMRRVDSAAYADQDWKSLAADYDIGSEATSGETMATILGDAAAIVAETSEAAEAAPAEVEAAKEAAEEVVEEAAEKTAEKPAE